MVSIYALGGVSGGNFNPAVSLTLGLSEKMPWKEVAIYCVVQIAAGICAGLSFAAMLWKVVNVAPKPDFGGSPDYELGTRCVSEFLGTYVLVLTVGLNVLGGSPAGAWSIAASLMVMIFALGNCSGAHFNPAVTVAIMISGRGCCSPRDGGAYIVTQLVAGVCASYTYAGMHHGKTFALEPAGGHNWSQALAGEFVYTFVLRFVVLSVATVKSPLSQYFGLAIGSCVTVGGVAIGNVSGGSLNPAVSTGISAARILGGGHFYNCLIYSAFEFWVRRWPLER